MGPRLPSERISLTDRRLASTTNVPKAERARPGASLLSSSGPGRFVFDMNCPRPSVVPTRVASVVTATSSPWASITRSPSPLAVGISTGEPAPGSTTKMRSGDTTNPEREVSKSASNSTSPPPLSSASSKRSLLSMLSEAAPITPSSLEVALRNTASRPRGRTCRRSMGSPTSIEAVTSSVTPLINRTRPRAPSSTQTTGSLSETPADAWLPRRKTRKKTRMAPAAKKAIHAHRGSEILRTVLSVGTSERDVRPEFSYGRCL